MGVGGACGDGAPGAGGTRPGHRLARAGGSRELLNSLGLARTCSPSDFSFSELLSSASGGTRAGRGGGGARRCLRFDDDASAQRALYDSRGSAPLLLAAQRLLIGGTERSAATDGTGSYYSTAMCLLLKAHVGYRPRQCAQLLAAHLQGAAGDSLLGAGYWRPGCQSPQQNSAFA